MDKIVYHTKRSNTHARPRLVCGVGKTDQSFRKECEVDRILYKYTHHLPLQDWQMKHDIGTYADVSAMPKDPAEYREWSEMVQAKFAELPAELRRAYGDNAFEFASALTANPQDLAGKVAKIIADDKRRMNPDLFGKMDEISTKLDTIAKPVVETPNKEITKNASESTNS